MASTVPSDPALARGPLHAASHVRLASCCARARARIAPSAGGPIPRESPAGDQASPARPPSEVPGTSGPGARRFQLGLRGPGGTACRPRRWAARRWAPLPSITRRNSNLKLKAALPFRRVKVGLKFLRRGMSRLCHAARVSRHAAVTLADQLWHTVRPREHTTHTPCGRNLKPY